MDFHTENINTIIINNKIYRFKAELNECTNAKRHNLLMKIINELSSDPLENFRNYNLNLCNYEYKKKWFLLKDFQKKEKLNEFLAGTKIQNEKKKLLINKIIEENNNKNISYDQVNGKIITLNMDKILTLSEE